ncbi:cytochrome P450-like protein [Euroglyphus maynei]|uniref:Cytochrome P450-like protein n=1 Tax=Euroglyphus maynei TaxID=6958 RepID=A0A1Y3BIS7_EURMA|nr:cytochrome P450-like protein [Euroglyphus maynei]
MSIFSTLWPSVGILGSIGLSILIMIPFVYFYSQYKFNYWKRKGVKGPPTLPFIGNFLIPGRPIPLMQMDHLREYGKFFGMYQGRRPILSISDPAIIKRILVKDFNKFHNRMPTNDSNITASQNLVSARYDKWKRIRSILTPMFTTSKLRKMEGLMVQCVDSLYDVMGRLAKTESSFLVHNVMGNFTMDVISKCAFATDTNAHDENENTFVRNARKLFEFNFIRALGRFLVPIWMKNILKAFHVKYFLTPELDFFINISFELIKQRKQNSTVKYNDMLELMIKAKHGNDQLMEEEDRFDSHHVNVGNEEQQQEQKLLSEIIGSKYLSEEEIVAQSVIFFAAGYETTASTLTFALYELAMNPDMQNRLYDEVMAVVNNGDPLDYDHVMKLSYLDAFIAETLRLHSPVLMLNRQVNDTYHIPEYNYTMEKDECVIIPIYAIHHNPEFHPDPERFDPERFMPENRDKMIPYSYLPFGGGPRNCIGMRFAMSEAKLGLTRLIKDFIFFKSPKTCDELKIKSSFVLLKTTPILVGVKRRN